MYALGPVFRFVAQIGNGLAQSGVRTSQHLYSLSTSESYRQNSFHNWQASHRSKALADKFNGQIRGNFLKALQKSNYGNRPALKLSIQQYAKLYRKTQDPLFKASRLLDRFPITRLAGIIALGALAPLIGLPALITSVALAGFYAFNIVFNLRNSLVERKLRATEAEFSATFQQIIGVPDLFLAKNGKLYLAEREYDTKGQLALKNPMTGDLTPVDNTDFLEHDLARVSAFKISTKAAGINFTRQDPSWLLSLYDPQNKKFQTAQKIPAEGYEALQLSLYSAGREGLNLAELEELKSEYAVDYDYRLMICLNLIFGKDNCKALKQTLASQNIAVSFELGEQNAPGDIAVLKALRPFRESLSLSALKDKVELEDLIYIAQHYPNLAAGQAIIITTMLEDKNFGASDLGFKDVLEVVANMSQSYTAMAQSFKTFIEPNTTDIQSGKAGWGSIFASIWSKYPIIKEFGYEAAKDISQNYLLWGKTALQLAQSKAQDFDSFEALKDAAVKASQTNSNHVEQLQRLLNANARNAVPA